MAALGLAAWWMLLAGCLLLVEGQRASSSKVAREKGVGGEVFKEAMGEVARGKEKSRSSDKPTELVSSDQF